MSDPKRDLDADPEVLDDDQFAENRPDGLPWFPKPPEYEPGVLGDGPFLPDDEDDEEEAVDTIVRKLTRRGLLSIAMRGR